MKLKRALALGLAVLMIVATSVAGTIAWLVAETDEVTNTFTVGKIEIELKEHELKDDGSLNTANEVTANDNYKVVPGATQPKDPFVRVKGDSEKCYLYVLVTNNLVIDTDKVATCDIYPNWEAIGTNGNSTLYRHNAIVDASEGDQLVQVFSAVSYDGEKITAANINDLAGKTIVVDAFAHQSDNTTQNVADTAAINHFNVTAIAP